MSTLVAVALLSIPWRWLPSLEIGPIDVEPAPVKREVEPARVAITPAPAPSIDRTVQLADEVVLRGIESQRAAFLGCWRRALAADPLLEATKVKLRVEIDAAGGVVAVTHDATSAKLGNCLAMIARSVKFAAPAQRAVAEFPLVFGPD